MSRSVRFIIMVLVSAICVCLVEKSASARTYYVRKSGSDRNSGTSANSAFKTLSRAFLEPLTYGDTVYIGAGTYTKGGAVRTFLNGALGSVRTGSVIGGGTDSHVGSRPLRVIADTTGQFTGDRGAVVVAAANRWAVTVPALASVQFEGLTFGPSRPRGRHFGIFANGTTASITIQNCTFQNLHYGTLVYFGRLSVSNCSFRNNVYGAYTSRAVGCLLQDCRFIRSKSIAAVAYGHNSVTRRCSFEQARYGLYVRGVDRSSQALLDKVSVSGCTYGLYGHSANVVLDGSTLQFQNCANDIYLNRCESRISDFTVKAGRRPITLVAGTAAIQRLNIRESKSYGVYAVAMDKLILTGSRFGKTPSWSAYLHGRDLSVSDCHFDQPKNGLRIRGQIASAKVTLSNLSFNRCNQGLYCQQALVNTNSESVISTTNCKYGVVLNRCGSVLEGLNSRGDTRPVSVYGGQAQLARVQITNAKNYGIYTANVTQLEVTDSRFNQTGSWAVHAHGRNLSIRDSAFNRSRFGLYARELSNQISPEFRNLSFNRCTYGVRSDNSVIDVGSDSQLAFSDCVYGVTLLRCKSKLQGIELSGSQRPLSLVRGAATIDGLSIAKSKSIGVYTSTMDRLSIANCDLGETGSWAVYAHGKELSVTSTKFTGSRHGLFVKETTGTKSPVLSDLQFAKCSGTGLRVASSMVNLGENSSIRVSNCGYGIYLLDCASTLRGLSLSSSNIPLYLNGGKCKIDGAVIEDAGTHGLLAYRMSECSVQNLKCSGAGRWGFYGRGQNFLLSNVTVASCRNGVYVDGEGSRVPISMANVSVQDNTGYGLYLRDASFSVSPESTLKILRNGSAGLYVAGQSIDLNSESGVEVTDNGIGIYASRTDVKMSGFKLNGNGYGLLQHYGKLECRDSSVSGGRFGIYQNHSSSCLIENSTISGAERWGLVVSNSQAKSQNLTLNDSKIVKCGGGVSARMLSDGQLRITESTIADNRGHGIYSWRATSRLSGATVARNRGYGVLHYDGPLDVVDSTIEDSRRIGLMAYGYQDQASARISVRRNRITGNATGVYAFRVDQAEIVNNVSARNRTYGVALNVTGQGEGEVWNNSIVDNRYGIWHIGGTGRIRNNIITNGDMKAKTSNSFGIYRSGGKVEAGYNLLFGQKRKYVNTPPGAGDVIKPPRFVSHGNGDYRLAAGSPAINAGTSPGRLMSVDIQGLSRPMFNAFEIGAFEYPEKSGSVRILDWGEMAAPPKSVIPKGVPSLQSLLQTTSVQTPQLP